DGDKVADAHGAFKEQDETRCDVARDELQTEADANRERREDDGQRGQVETKCSLEREEDADSDDEIMYQTENCVLNAGIEPRMTSHPAFHERTHGARDENGDHEDEDADDHVRQRNLELADCEF